jgi:hypothetical protein
VKPLVGFTLPSAGVTPAPSDKKVKMRDFVPVRTFFVSFLSEAKNPGSFLDPDLLGQEELRR